MQFFAILFLLLQVAIAAPLLPRQATSSAAHPAIEALEDVAAKLQLVIREVDRYNGDRQAGDILVRDSMEALQNLHVAIKEVDNGGDIGLFQAMGFLPVATNLINNAFTLARSVKAKSEILTKSDPIRTYQVLDQCYHGVSMLAQAFDKKLPGGVAALMRGINGSVVSTLKDTRDSFQSSATIAKTLPDPFAGQPQPNIAPQNAQPYYPPQQQQQQQPPSAWQPQPAQFQPQGQQFGNNAQPQGFGQGQGQGLGQEDMSQDSQPKYAPYPSDLPLDPIPVSQGQGQGQGVGQQGQQQGWWSQ